MSARRGSLRIIGGQWRGRRLPIIDAGDLRPTPDRVRETLFNWLQADVPGSHCLDLFAGTGVLAFEALSRGAEQVTAVESNPRACQQMRDSAIELGTERLTVICADVGDYLQRTTGTFTRDQNQTATDGNSADWNILFVDPPYKLGYPPPQWPLISDHPNVAADAFIYIESHAHQRDITLDGTLRHWHEKRHKVAGEVCYRLLQSTKPAAEE